jgi:hypothetical protein
MAKWQIAHFNFFCRDGHTFWGTLTVILPFIPGILMAIITLVQDKCLCQPQHSLMFFYFPILMPLTRIGLLPDYFKLSKVDIDSVFSKHFDKTIKANFSKFFEIFQNVLKNC